VRRVKGCYSQATIQSRCYSQATIQSIQPIQPIQSHSKRTIRHAHTDIEGFKKRGQTTMYCPHTRQTTMPTHDRPRCIAPTHLSISTPQDACGTPSTVSPDGLYCVLAPLLPLLLCLLHCNLCCGIATFVAALLPLLPCVLHCNLCLYAVMLRCYFCGCGIALPCHSSRHSWRWLQCGGTDLFARTCLLHVDARCYM